MRAPSPWPALVAVLLALLTACSGSPTPAAPGPGSPPRSGTADPPVPCSPSTALAGWSDALDGARVGDRDVASLSGLAAQPDGTVLAIEDRSVLFTLDPRADRVLAATPLADPAGRELDAEAVVAEPGGTRLVTDEGGPQVVRFDAGGAPRGTLPVPDDVRVAPLGRGVPNATFEGLARQPDGTLVASMEKPLIGDEGGLTRLVTWAPGDVPAAQFALPLDRGLGVSELAATGDGRLLVVERGYDADVGNTVHLVLADLRGATDVRAVPRLQPGAVTPARTTLLADLGDCPALGATSRQRQRNPLLDNLEGLTVTGRRPDGALDLLLVSDDNQRASQVTRTYRLVLRM